MDAKLFLTPGRYTLPSGEEIYDVNKWVAGLDLKCFKCGNDDPDIQPLVYPMSRIRALAAGKDLVPTEPHDAHVVTLCDDCKVGAPDDSDRDAKVKFVLNLLAEVDETTTPHFHVDTTAKLVFHTRVKPSALRAEFEGLPIKVNKSCFEIVEPGHLYFTNDDDDQHVSIFPEQKKVMVVERTPEEDGITFFGWPKWGDIDTFVSYLRKQDGGQEYEWAKELFWTRINRQTKKRQEKELLASLGENGGPLSALKAVIPALKALADKGMLPGQDECDCPSCSARRESEEDDE